MKRICLFLVIIVAAFSFFAFYKINKVSACSITDRACCNEFSGTVNGNANCVAAGGCAWNSIMERCYATGQTCPYDNLSNSNDIAQCCGDFSYLVKNTCEAANCRFQSAQLCVGKFAPTPTPTSTPTPPPSSFIAQNPTFSIGTPQVSGGQLKISGTFKGGMIYWQNACYTYGVVLNDGVKYQIDNGSESTLSCWSLTTGGENQCGGGGGGGAVCGNGICEPGENHNTCSEDCTLPEVLAPFENALGFFRNIVRPVQATDVCGYSSTCHGPEYSFNNSCSVSIAGLANGSHVLKLKFNFYNPPGGSQTIQKTFSIGSIPPTPHSGGECDISKNSSTNANSDCISKYGYGTICCRQPNSQHQYTWCDQCAGGVPTPTPTSTPTPSVTLTPIITPVPTPFCNISANPGAINQGGSSNLNWSSVNVSSCTGTGSPSYSEWNGSIGLSGSKSVSPTSNNSYQLNCSGSLGDVSCSATVGVGVAPTQDLSVQAYVKNLSANTGWWASSVSAQPGDRISFSIQATAIGNTVVNDVLVADVLSGKLSFINGSIMVGGQQMSGDLFGRGIDIGALNPGQSKEVNFEAFVAATDQFVAGSTEALTNTSTVQGVGVVAKTATSQVRVGISSVQDVSLLQTARNLSKNESFSPNPQAVPGDTMEFKLEIGATGNTVITNVQASEDLSSVFQYVVGSVKVNGSTVGGDLFGNGISLGSISVGQAKIITFSAKVSEDYSYDLGDNYFQNTAKVSADSLYDRYDVMEARVSRSASQSLSVLMGVRNIDNNQSFPTSYVSVYPGQKLEFSISLENSGETDLNNLVIKDILPWQIKYVSGTTSIDGSAASDGITTGGLNIDSITQGDTKVIIFQAQVGSVATIGSLQKTLINQASLTGSGLNISRSLNIFVNQSSSQNTGSVQNTLVSTTKEVLSYNETKGQDATMVSANPGDTIRFYLLNRNNNSIAIANYEIKNDISDILKAGEITSNGGGNAIGSNLTFPAANIPSDSTISKEFTVKIKAAESWNNVNQISDTYGNSVAINLEKPYVAPEPNLTVSKTVSNLTWVNGSDVQVVARPNDQLQFTIEVVNTSPVMVGDVKVVENIPQKINFVNAEGGGSYNSLTSQAVWELGALLPNEKRELTMLANVSSDAFIPSEFSFIAKAEASTGIKDLTLNSNEVKTNITGFNNPYGQVVKIIAICLLVILVGVVIFFIIKHFKKRKKAEYVPL